jgi:hypothetical protein
MIVDLIKTTVESMDQVSGLDWIFLDAELYELNENQGYNTAGQPVAFLIHPITAKNEINDFSGGLQKEFKIEIMLIQASSLADKQPDRNLTMGRMYTAEKEFIKRLLLNTGIEEITNSDSEEIYNAFDNNFDGLLIHATIKANPEIYCG